MYKNSHLSATLTDWVLYYSFLCYLPIFRRVNVSVIFTCVLFSFFFLFFFFHNVFLKQTSLLWRKTLSSNWTQWNADTCWICCTCVYPVSSLLQLNGCLVCDSLVLKAPLLILHTVGPPTSNHLRVCHGEVQFVQRRSSCWSSSKLDVSEFSLTH